MIHYRPLGIYRFTLAGMVVVSHTHILSGGNLSVFLGHLGIGTMAVMAFFVLSGFVIAEALATYYSGRPGAFLVNRFLRIFPPFFLALGFSLLIHWNISQLGELQFFDPLSNGQRSLMFSTENIIANALCLIIIYGLSHFGLILDYLFVRFVWAVAVELHFYYVAAAFVYFLQLVKDRKLSAYTPLISWISAVLFVILFILAMVAPHKLLFYAVWIPYFVLGMAIFHLITQEKYVGHCYLSLTRNRWMVWGTLAVIGVNWHAYNYMSKNPANWVGVDLVVLNILVVAMLLLSRCTIKGRFKAVDRWIGDITYPLYLNHYAVSIATLSLAPVEYRGLPLFMANFITCIVVSICLSYVSEPITRKLRSRIRGAYL